MTKKPAAKKKPASKAPYRGAAGLTEVGVDGFIDAAEDKDRGTTRFPWPQDVKDAIKAAVEGAYDGAVIKAKINEIVVARLGGGLFNKGPLA